MPILTAPLFVLTLLSLSKNSPFFSPTEEKIHAKSEAVYQNCPPTGHQFSTVVERNAYSAGTHPSNRPEAYATLGKAQALDWLTR